MCTCVKIERESVAGRLGTGRFRLLRPLGHSISFHALSVAALLIDNLHYRLVAGAVMCSVDVCGTLNVKS